MAKYRIIFDGELEDEIFDTYEEAEGEALYLLSCWHEGGEVMEMSNPGDYSYEEDNEPEYEIVREDEINLEEYQ